MTGADLSQLNGRELDAAIGAAMDLDPHGDCEACDGGGEVEVPWSDSDYGPRYMDCPLCDGIGGENLWPLFSTSLDALSAGPERVLREGGAWEIVGAWFRTSENVSVYEATIHVRAHGGPFCGRGATEAEARARACLAALTAIKEQETTNG